MNKTRNPFHLFNFTLLLMLSTITNAGTYTINGSIVSFSTANINAGTLCGCGYIEAPEILITCDEFAFEGTIKPYTECIIRCKKPFNYDMFTKNGTGSITVYISPYAYIKYTKATLLDFSQKTLLENLDIIQESLYEQIRLIRYYAASNDIDEKYIFECIFKKIDEKSHYLQDCIDGKCDNSILQKLSHLLKAAGFSTIGLGISYGFYKYAEHSGNKGFVEVAIYGSILSVMPLLAGLRIAFEKPKDKDLHRKKLAQLNTIKDGIEESLSNPLVLQEEQIIKLQ